MRQQQHMGVRGCILLLVPLPNAWILVLEKPYMVVTGEGTVHVYVLDLQEIGKSVRLLTFYEAIENWICISYQDLINQGNQVDAQVLDIINLYFDWNVRLNKALCTPMIDRSIDRSKLGIRLEVKSCQR